MGCAGTRGSTVVSWSGYPPVTTAFCSRSTVCGSSRSIRCLSMHISGMADPELMSRVVLAGGPSVD
eukprot:448884-Rhodomonas_salina.1